MKTCEQEWYDTMHSMNAISTVSYWNKRAEDYNNFIQTSEFCYGEQIVDILLRSGFLNRNMSVLEIAGGVGALTLPLCGASKKVTTIEPAVEMVKNLQINAASQKINNLEVLLETCQQTADQRTIQRHDATVMCHASWQFPDLVWLLDFMESMGSGKVCIADSVKDSNRERERLYAELGVYHHTIDRFSKLSEAITALGRAPESKTFTFSMRRSTDSACSMITQVLSKYRQVETEDKLKIERFVAERSHNGIYTEESTMGMLWWQNSQARRPQ